MAIQILNNGDAAVTFRSKINSNFSELNSSKAPTSHASSSNVYGLGSTNEYGHLKVTVGNGLGINNGTVSMVAGTTSTVGAVQLVNSYTSDSTSMAATGAAIKNGLETTVKTFSGSGTPASSLGKNGDIYIKTS